MAKREGFYDCVFSSDRNEYQFHLRAWDGEEAERRLRELLQGYGIGAKGTLLIRDLRGRLVRQAAYPA